MSGHLCSLPRSQPFISVTMPSGEPGEGGLVWQSSGTTHKLVGMQTAPVTRVTLTPIIVIVV